MDPVVVCDGRSLCPEQLVRSLACQWHVEKNIAIAALSPKQLASQPENWLDSQVRPSGHVL